MRVDIKYLLSVRVLMLTVLSTLLYGCGSLSKSGTEADGVFPASVGSFRREIAYKEKEANYLNEKNKNQKYKERDAKYTDGKDQIFYGVSTHQTPADAINEQGEEAVYGNNSVWKTVDLKDKSGATVGKMTICRVKDHSSNADSSVSGGFNYSLAFNVGNQNHQASLYAPSNNTTQEQTDKLVAFVKTIPAAAQLDLSELDLITASAAGKRVTAEKLSAISPPVKTAAPYLKGKTAVVVTGNFAGVKTEEYFKDAARQANLMEEIGSVVKIDCSKGASIGQYTSDKGLKIPAFSSVCKVTIIDNTIPATIAQKTFTSTAMVDNMVVKTDRKGEVSNYNKEYVAPTPTFEIAEFLSKLPIK